MTLDDEKLLKRLIGARAYIFCHDFGGLYPAYTDGSRRTKPVCWVEKNDYQRMVALGWLCREGVGFRVSDAMQEHFSQPAQGRARASKAKDLGEETRFVPDGVQRKVTVNQRANILVRLSRKRDRYGGLWLTAGETEAGLQFARDYDGAGVGQVLTQTYAGPRVDGTRKTDVTETLLINRLDREKRYYEAIACLGPGLDRAVIAVCCENWSLDQLERSEKWARNTGATVLKMALGRLAAFYGTEVGVRPERSLRP